MFSKNVYLPEIVMNTFSLEILISNIQHLEFV